MAKTTKKPCRRCWVPTCRNSKPKEAAKKKLFLFPRDVARCREWIKAIGDVTLAETELKKLNTIRFVCEDHFPPSKITPQTRPAADAVPVFFNPVRRPLTEDDLQAFDVQAQLDDGVPELHIDFTHSTNQDSCMSGSSSDFSHSSFELSTHSSDRYYSLESNDENNLGSLRSDVSEDADFPWLELSLPSLDTRGVDLSDTEEERSLAWGCNESVLCDSERLSMSSIPAAPATMSPPHSNYSIVQMSSSPTYQNCSLDSSDSSGVCYGYLLNSDAK
ncbi:hypothetical protein R5R35_010378 [Gryllus longicercus]|uniref:THAP-type domain-containing protein n=1 Tax=Gryllus longicercus TaxID=2509291 RepID=A0AAN9UZ19_9ORTH